MNWSFDIELGPNPKGNLNHDGVVDADDIDLVFSNLGSDDAGYDLDGDGDVDPQDVDHLVLNVMGKRFGDTDLDQDVDIIDFNHVALNFDPLGQNPFNGWAQGNLDGDSDGDISDVMLLVMNYKPIGYTPPNSPTVIMGQTSPTPVATGAQRWSPDPAKTANPSSLNPHQLAQGDLRSNERRGREARVERESNGNRSTGEQIYVDHYFRSARRRRSGMPEHEALFSLQ